MILHIGGDEIVYVDRVIAILDAQAVNCADTRAFLEACYARCRKVTVTGDEPKSIIVALDDQKLPGRRNSVRKRRTRRNKTLEDPNFCQYMLYESPISSLTLQKRSGQIGDISL